MLDAVKAAFTPSPSRAEVDALLREAVALATTLEKAVATDAAMPVTRAEVRSWLRAGSVPTAFDTSHHAAVLARVEKILDNTPDIAVDPSSTYTLAQAAEMLRGSILLAEGAK